jgi:tRNA threonylcarbamoyladenosine biosynthesis protein TsaB
MLLLINTTDLVKVEFSLIQNINGKEKVIKKTKALSYETSHKTLEVLWKFLESQKVDAKKIEKIVVTTGAGSYTGIRIGVAIAKALSLSWNVPLEVVDK